MDKKNDHKRSAYSELRLLVLASLLLSALSYVTNILLANVMGPVTFGKYSYALVLGALFAQLIPFGTVEAGIRLRATFGERSLDWILTLKLLNFTILGGAVCLGFFFWGEIALLFGMIVALNGLSLTTQYEAQGKNVRFMAIYLVERAIITISLWLVLLFVETQYLFWTFTILLFVQIGSLAYQYNENRQFSFSTNLRALYQTYKLGFFVLLFELSKFAFGGITRIVIFNKLGDESLGIFATAWQFVPLSTLYLAQTIKAWRLRLTNAIDARNATLVGREFLWLSAAALLPTALGCCVLYLKGEWIISLVFTKEYQDAGGLMPYFAVYIMVVAFDSIMVMLAIAAGLAGLVGIIYFAFGGLTTLITLFMLNGLGTEAYLSTIILGHLGAVITLSLSTIKELRSRF